MPYLVTDRVQPAQRGPFHSEVCLCGAFLFCADRRQRRVYVADDPVDRANRTQYGLPMDAVVFASFTQLYKVGLTASL